MINITQQDNGRPISLVVYNWGDSHHRVPVHEAILKISPTGEMYAYNSTLFRGSVTLEKGFWIGSNLKLRTDGYVDVKSFKFLDEEKENMKDIVVRTPQLVTYKKLMGYLNSKGKKVLTVGNWDLDKSDTCVRIGTDINYSGAQFYEQTGYEIISYSEFMKREKQSKEEAEFKKPAGRRTFRLLKDTPDLKKGALFQEACDDGDQEYKNITPEMRRFDDYEEYFGNDGTEGYTRKEVENNPKWFEEVYSVAPKYMNKEELLKYNKLVKRATK